MESWKVFCLPSLQTKQGSKFKKILWSPMVTNWKNLVASLYNVNAAAESTTRSIRFDCLKILRTEVGINLEVNWLFMRFGTFFMTKAKQDKMNVCFNFTRFI